MVVTSRSRAAQGVRRGSGSAGKSRGVCLARNVLRNRAVSYTTTLTLDIMLRQMCPIKDHLILVAAENTLPQLFPLSRYDLQLPTCMYEY